MINSFLILHSILSILILCPSQLSVGVLGSWVCCFVLALAAEVGGLGQVLSEPCVSKRERTERDWAVYGQKGQKNRRLRRVDLFLFLWGDLGVVSSPRMRGGAERVHRTHLGRLWPFSIQRFLKGGPQPTFSGGPGESGDGSSKYFKV